jgi:transcriptional regulator with XRE-family HTH domain
MSSPKPLSARLRQLRNEHFGKPVRQKTLSAALRVSPPLISSWENGIAVPSVDRLEDVARFFASTRSVEQGRLLDDTELASDERRDRERLAAELLSLRPEDSGNVDGDFWRFPEGPVRIICGQRDPVPDEASPDSRNFMALTSYADLDSLVELFGHVRAYNPTADVRFARPDLLRDDDMQAHLVVLGNIAVVQSALEKSLLDLPVTQVGGVLDDGEVFDVAGPDGVERFEPTFASDGTLVEDVGFLARMPSPINPDRTVTICSGVYTRGVYGAVRCLTDQATARFSQAYLRAQFSNVATFGVLMRVHVVQNLVPTPRLDNADGRLFEFSR